jgi:hypothetical protein
MVNARADLIPATAGPLPTDDGAQDRAATLVRELAWLAQLIDARFERYFQPGTPGPEPLQIVPPDLAEARDPYAELLRQHGAGALERAALALALAPQLRPQLLDVFHTRNASFDRPFTEFGGQRDEQGDFQPTVETLVFLLAGTDLAGRFAVQALFDREHWFHRLDVLRLQRPERAPSALAKSLLRPSEAVLAGITTGRPHRPALSAEFPASAITTALDWPDLVLHPVTLGQVQEIALWLRHGPRLMGELGMAARLRPGLRALFHGPPGTGKTLTAGLLGRSTGREVYRIDLSLVVSKYIGETEKNLARVFDQAQHKGWILFFDEADALFGKRTETQDAHDRYANQEVSFLLQRIETFDGVAVLATNQRDNIDPAFARRFEAVIYFPLPSADERLRLWQQALPRGLALAPDVDLAALAHRHELCGGAIVNAVRHAALAALARGDDRITQAALNRGVQRELAKEGRAA